MKQEGSWGHPRTSAQSGGECQSVINLLHELDDEEGNPLMITNVLEAGAYGINPRDFYL